MSNPMKAQNIDISKETIAHFCQHWHITKLSLFGSILRDDFRPDSDKEKEKWQSLRNTMTTEIDQLISGFLIE